MFATTAPLVVFERLQEIKLTLFAKQWIVRSYKLNSFDDTVFRAILELELNKVGTYLELNHHQPFSVHSGGSSRVPSFCLRMLELSRKRLKRLVAHNPKTVPVFWNARSVKYSNGALAIFIQAI